jgi:hypothetical protein
VKVNTLWKFLSIEKFQLYAMVRKAANNVKQEMEEILGGNIKTGLNSV